VFSFLTGIREPAVDALGVKYVTAGEYGDFSAENKVQQVNRTYNPSELIDILHIDCIYADGISQELKQALHL